MEGTEKPKILVVDDEPVIIELIAGIFENDYEVFFATNGEKALEIAGTVAPDLILLDVMMPGLDGFATCARLKADPLTATIPVIFITSLGDTVAETRGLELGAMDYLTKPINPQVVKVRVRNQVELKLALDQLTRLATTDGLTSLPNRRRFDETIAREHARHQRSGLLLSVIMLDIDHFKLFNDTYGHVLGDDCLRAVASVVNASMQRSADLAARYGGEEFVCVLPDARDPKSALTVAERIRQSVLELRIAHSSSPTSSFVTVSLGVVTMPCTAATTPDLFVSHADTQLYLAKAGGRNRICHVVPEL